jgi:hypothetical protein
VEVKGAAVKCWVTNATTDTHKVFNHVDEAGLRVDAVDGRGIAVVFLVVIKESLSCASSGDG